MHRFRSGYFHCHLFVSAHGTRVALTALVETKTSDKTPKGRFLLNFVHHLIWGLLRPTVCVRSKDYFSFFLLLYIFGSLCRLSTFCVTQKCKAGCILQKGLSSTLGNHQIHPHSFCWLHNLFLEKKIASSCGNRYISGSSRLYAAYDAGSLI